MSQPNVLPDIVSSALLIFGLNILVMFLVVTIPFIGLVQELPLPEAKQVEFD